MTLEELRIELELLDAEYAELWHRLKELKAQLVVLEGVAAAKRMKTIQYRRRRVLKYIEALER